MMTVTQWIKNRYTYTEFDGRKIKNILHFSLVWNIFERACCQCNAQIKQSHSIAENLQNESIPSLKKTWIYFQNRYVQSNQLTGTFNSFNFNDNDRKEWVGEILLSNLPSQEQKIEALLRIIFRLRNNLMHGEKEPQIFYEQDKNFKHANTFLMDICNLRRDETCPDTSSNRRNTL
jgi:hypothetical protein